MARRLGLEIIGTLGLLKVMKLKGIIRKKPFIGRLRGKEFYISDDLVNKPLSDVEET